MRLKERWTVSQPNSSCQRIGAIVTARACLGSTAPSRFGTTLPDFVERKPSGISSAAVIQPRCFSQFQLSFSLQPRWGPAPPAKSALSPARPCEILAQDNDDPSYSVLGSLAFRWFLQRKGLPCWIIVNRRAESRYARTGLSKLSMSWRHSGNAPKWSGIVSAMNFMLDPRMMSDDGPLAGSPPYSSCLFLASTSCGFT